MSRKSVSSLAIARLRKKRMFLERNIVVLQSGSRV
jgi:hypothetical protein